MSANHLGGETSPYLLQHKTNPVWWYPWSQEAFHAAQTEKKPIFLSIGYSTCHWCHVMEKDSFEKEDVAEILNRHFISIKVDREERPDVDSLYMNAVQAMNGSGGWPLSALLTPEGKPFWGGTFLPHDILIDLLEKIKSLWTSDPERILGASSELTNHLKEISAVPRVSEIVGKDILVSFIKQFERRYDLIHGGLGSAPKFPSALALSLLMRLVPDEPRHHQKTHNSRDPVSEKSSPLSMVTHTLDQMRRGGMYDQVGGGFHRYSTDEKWLIPHFEKMLYDNALLAQTYFEAYQLTQNEDYLQVGRDILDYILRDLAHPGGGFCCGQDADSEGIEGKYFVWSSSELKEILNPDEFKFIMQTYGVTKEGNFHAHRTGDEVTSKRHDPPALRGHVFFLEANALLPYSQSVFQSARKKLLSARYKRIPPHLDDKVLTSWTSLTISAFTKGFQVTGELQYLEASQKGASFILQSLLVGEKLYRSYRNKKVNVPATCEDYAFLIEALLNLYSTDFNEDWFMQALTLQSRQDQLFWDSIDGGYYESDGSDKNLLLRLKNFEDGVVPSSNSVSISNLRRLFSYTGEIPYREKYLATLKAGSALYGQYPQAGAKALQNIDRDGNLFYELAICLSDPKEVGLIIKPLWSKFFPYLDIALKSAQKKESQIPLLRNRETQNGKTTYYLCQNQSCQRPSHDIEEVLLQFDLPRR